MTDFRYSAHAIGQTCNIIEKTLTFFAVKIGYEEMNPVMKVITPFWGTYAGIVIAATITSIGLFELYHHSDKTAIPLYIFSVLYLLGAIWNSIIVMQHFIGTSWVF